MKVFDNSGTRINNVPLTAMGLVLTSPISVGAATLATSLVSVPGMDGSLDLSLRNLQKSVYSDRRPVTLQLAAVGTLDEVVRAQTILGSYNGQEVYVYDARYGGEWRGTLSLGEWANRVESWNGQVSATVTATVNAEPTLLVTGKALTFNPTTQAASYFSFSIGGNRSTWPVFVLTPNGTSNVIGVHLYDGMGTQTGSIRYSRSTTITAPVTIDCENEIMTMSGNVIFPSIMEDFPTLAPGAAKILPVGCSQVVMSYRPRLML